MWQEIWERQDAENLTSVFSNADKAVELKAVMDVAKETLGTDDGAGTKKLDQGSASILANTLKNADKASELKEVMETSADLGLQDAENLTAVFSNADKAVELKAVMDVAKETLGTDDGSGKKKLDQDSASILANTLQNADKASELKEVMETSADLGLQDAENLTAVFTNADKATELKAVMDVAKETLGTDDGTGTKKLDEGSASILANTLKNADKAAEMKEVMEVSADLGLQDSDTLTSVFTNADKIEDLKAVMDVAKETLGTDDGTGTKKLDEGSAAILANTLKNADKAAEMKEVMEVSADLGLQDSDTLTSVFTNADKIEDLKAVMDVAKETLGTDDGTGKKKLDEGAAILANTLKNADKAAEMKEVMEVSADLGLQDSDTLTSVFTNADKIDDLKAVMDVAKESIGTDDGTGVKKLDPTKASFLADTLRNADKATQYRKVTDQLKDSSVEIDQNDVFSNLDGVSETFALIESEDGTIDAAAAANLIAGAKDIEESKKAIQRAKDAGIDAVEIAKKDVEEQRAINSVVEKLQEAGGADAANNFLSSGAAEDALQYDLALNDDPDLAGAIASAVTDSTGDGESALPNVDIKAKIQEKVTDSTKGKLVNEYQDNDLYRSIIEENEARAQDISFALSFVEKESAQEKALFANIDKLDSIMVLGRFFKDDDTKLEIVFNNLDHANSLYLLVEEFKNMPSKIDLVLENPELS